MDDSDDFVDGLNFDQANHDASQDPLETVQELQRRLSTEASVSQAASALSEKLQPG